MVVCLGLGFKEPLPDASFRKPGRQVALGDRLFVDSTVLDTAAGGYKAWTCSLQVWHGI